MSAAASPRRVAAVARKELRQLLRDRLTLGLAVLIPALQLVLFGYAIDLDVRHVPTAVLDRAQSALSRKLVGELEATQTFQIRRRVQSEAEAIGLLAASEVGAVLVIPADFDRHLYRRSGAEISVLADASDPVVASAVVLASQGLGQAMNARLAELPEPVRVEVLPFYNPGRRSAVFIVPGLVGVIPTMTMMLLTALAIVRERERGSFEFLIATPVQSGEVMAGKLLPYLAVGIVQIGIVLALGAWLFDVPIRGSLLGLGIGALPFLAAMLAAGLAVSSLARTQLQAAQIAFFFFLPSLLLSGFLFPFDAMPAAARGLGELLPLTHFLRVVRGILLKGAPLSELLGELLAIAAFGFAALAVATVAFRKRLA